MNRIEKREDLIARQKARLLTTEVCKCTRTDLRESNLRGRKYR